MAKALRTRLAATFGQVFLVTSRGQHFDQHGHQNHWNLLWDTIAELDTNADRKDILDLDIQAHNQATSFQEAGKLSEGRDSSAGGAFFPRWIAGPIGLNTGGRRD